MDVSKSPGSIYSLELLHADNTSNLMTSRYIYSLATSFDLHYFDRYISFTMDIDKNWVWCSHDCAK